MQKADSSSLFDDLDAALHSGSSEKRVAMLRQVTDLFLSEADRLNDEMAEAFGALNPLMRRSLEAVAAGLDKLAESAADLCDPKRKSLTPGELESCVEISRSMRRLLDRANALIESAETPDIDAAPARNSDSSGQNDARSPPEGGEPRIARS